MNLTNCTLSKSDKTLVLQGMIHVAPKGLYRKLQEDLDAHIGKGYKIVYEGIKDYPKLYPNAAKREHEIADFFVILFRLYPILASAWGFELQKRYIKYPQGAVRADISFRRLVALLYGNGFRCGWFLSLLGFSKKLLGDKRYKTEIEYEVAKSNPLKEKRKDLGHFIVWLLFLRKMMPIILDYRNQIVVNTIERECDNGQSKLFVHYGEKHIKGMVKLLQRSGWAVKETSVYEIM